MKVSDARIQAVSECPGFTAQSGKDLLKLFCFTGRLDTIQTLLGLIFDMFQAWVDLGLVQVELWTTISENID